MVTEIPHATTRKRILSIDGGGFYGLSTLLVIDEILKVASERTQRTLRAFEVFDLICGTSGGGLVSLLLGELRMDCRTAIEVYKKATRELFGADETAFWNSILTYSPIDYKGYFQFLQDVTGQYARTDSPANINQYAKSLIPVMSDAPSYTNVLYHVRSYPAPSGGIASTPFLDRWGVVDTAIASTAAKRFYRPPAKELRGIPQRVSYRDAGFSGFSNPTALAIEEMKCLGLRNGIGAVVSFASPLTILVPRDSRGRINHRQTRMASYARKHAQELLRRANYAASLKSDLTKESARLLVTELITTSIEAELTHQEIATAYDGIPNVYHRIVFDTGISGTALVDCFAFERIESAARSWLSTEQGRTTISDIVDSLLAQATKSPEMSGEEPVHLEIPPQEDTNTKPSTEIEFEQDLPSNPPSRGTSEGPWQEVQSTNSQEHSGVQSLDSSVQMALVSLPEPEETGEVATLSEIAEAPPESPPLETESTVSLPTTAETSETMVEPVEAINPGSLPISPLLDLDQPSIPGANKKTKFIRNFDDVRSPKPGLLLASSMRPQLPPLSLLTGYTVDGSGLDSQIYDTRSSIDIPPAIETMLTLSESAPQTAIASAQPEPTPIVQMGRNDHVVNTAPHPTNFDKYLSDHEVIFIVANSSSMKGAPWEEAQDSLIGVAERILQVGSATVDLVFVNSGGKRISLQGSGDVESQFRTAKPGGRIFLEPILQRITGEYARGMDDLGNPAKFKSLSITVLLNDVPHDNSFASLDQLAQKLESRSHQSKPITVQFVPVGERDRGVEEELTKLIPANAQSMSLAKVVPHEDRLDSRLLADLLLSCG